MKPPATVIAAGLVLAASGSTANAQISNDVVKIGVLTDMSSLYEIAAIDLSLMVRSASCASRTMTAARASVLCNPSRRAQDARSSG